MANNTLVGFMPSPNCGRGTVDLIWNCLTTIVFCIWTALHVNVFTEKHTWKKLETSWYCVLAPELYAANAMYELARAMQIKKDLHLLAGWEAWTLKQSWMIRKAGLHLRMVGPGTDETLTPIVIVEVDKLVELAQSRIVVLEDLPTDDQIDLRSKRDWFAKTVAFTQVLWFAATIISRLHMGYDVSLVETITAAYVFCGMVMYFSYINCPQDVQEPWVLELDARYDVGTATILEQKRGPLLVFFAAVLLLGVFMGVHIAAWYYPFPSAIATWLWRASCIIGLGTGFVYVYYWSKIVVHEREEPEKNRMWSVVSRWSLFAASFTYCAARFTLVALAFASLTAAPRGIYDKPDWTVYWGHIGN